MKRLRMHRMFAPVEVRITPPYEGLRDFEVVSLRSIHPFRMSFGCALLADPNDDSCNVDAEARLRGNPGSEHNYRSAVRFAKWINRSPNRVERTLDAVLRRIDSVRYLI